MKKSKTHRGFALINFKDSNGEGCSIQQSSRATPHVWVGIDDPNPMVMASHAERLGVETRVQNGWVPYPIPQEVLLSTRMHLDKAALRTLIDALEAVYSRMPD